MLVSLLTSAESIRQKIKGICGQKDLNMIAKIVLVYLCLTAVVVMMAWLLNLQLPMQSYVM
jgi:hypothetical protein